MQLWSDVLAILKAPFVGDLDLLHLFALVGVILIFITAWVLILNYVRLAALELEAA
jgi:hypothetical protein